MILGRNLKRHSDVSWLLNTFVASASSSEINLHYNFSHVNSLTFTTHMGALSWPNVGTATEKKKPNARKGTDLAPWKYVNSSDYRTQYVPRVPSRTSSEWISWVCYTAMDMVIWLYLKPHPSLIWSMIVVNLQCKTRRTWKSPNIKIECVTFPNEDLSNYFLFRAIEIPSDH